ncbi:MarR family transcriptional regulator [Planomonospora sp. ID67723]|uniref:helix-turn-helix transcriptional regulator n=1 Tax=Planomonospora sp. ID67723 TaxID=2738134 RepID=UPI0018C3EF5B|nr:helix-turn-helix domain-containing protein [Planomonospora sp. ID67723]MBG0830062.1 MarR family transcriptional regulator [Planomonospora sp. ID67723]
MVSANGGGPTSTWTFLTHHARVLLEIARDPHARIRDIATRIGITERAVQSIVSDLHQEGYLTLSKVGRRNHYTLNPERGFRYPTEANLPVRLLIDLFTQHDLPDTGASALGTGSGPSRDPASTSR